MAVTLDSLRKAVKKNKGKSQSLAWLADMERSSGDYEAAMKIVDQALAASPSDVPAMLVRAKILVGMQDFAASITEYKKVLAKDPFCLSAHKRLGESYDKLGKVAERNACFRRVHDMDPLDSFWKEEYDIPTEEEQASLVPPPMDESSFTMEDVADEPETAETATTEEDNVFANLAASLPNTEDEDNSSMENLRDSLNFASDDLAKNPDGSDSPSFDENVLNSSEVSSAISGILGTDDDLDAAVSAKKAESVAEEESSSSLFSHFADDKIDDDEPKIEDKIDELLDQPLEEVAEKKTEESDLSLDSLDEPQAADEGISQENVDDAFTSLLGDDKGDDDIFQETEAPAQVAEAPAESVAESASPAEHMDFSNEENAETNVDDAFSSLLGDDDLPEEKPAETLAEPALEQTADLALDEPAVEEKPAETLSAAPAEEDSFGGLFEKSANADFSMSEAPAETIENVKPEEPAEEESFGNLFDKSADADFSMSDNAAEKSAAVEENVAAGALEKAPEFVPSESAEDIAPAEGLVPVSHMDFSDEDDSQKSNEDFVLNLDEDAPAESVAAVVNAETLEELAPEKPVVEEFVAPAVEESAAPVVDEPAAPAVEEAAAPVVEESVAEASSESASEDVDTAFDALFGDDDSSMESAKEEVKEEIKDDDLAKEMGGAFASMFGEESASPTNVAEAPAEEPLSQEATSAKIEEESVKETVDESFDSLFGSSDDLPEEASNVAATAAAAPAPVETAKVDEPAPASTFSAPAETQEEAPSAELDSIDSEVSNAFKGLFDEDDALTEADEPNNKGVDYLMSGDSDDEVAASLVNNADAPLSRGAADLDDSLNTRTLADIYMEQGVYNKALDIYSDLAKKNPNNAEIKTRLAEIEKLCREKFGDSQNG